MVAMEDIEAALEPMVSALKADGYLAQMKLPSDDLLFFEIVAGPGACEDCLIPKSMMAEMLGSSLQKAGAGSLQVELVYPVEDGPAATH
jgi:hypothetical protein